MRCFCVHSGAPDLIYPGTSLYEHILWMHLEKNRTYACTFPVQRKEINVVKVRFTMRYSSRKLSNDKVITTACNFWRQIACSFQVTSGNKIFEIPPFFSNPARGSGQKSSRMLITFFRPEGVLPYETGGNFEVNPWRRPIWGWPNLFFWPLKAIILNFDYMNRVNKTNWKYIIF